MRIWQRRTGSWIVLGTLCSLMSVACDKKPSADSDGEGSAVTTLKNGDTTPTEAQPPKKADAQKTMGSPSQDADSPAPNAVSPTALKEGEPATAPASGPLACDNDAHWIPQELKALKTGTIELAADGPTKSRLKWLPCEGEKKHCERLGLSDKQKLLAVGPHGNKVRLAVAETCGDNTSVSISTLNEEPSVVLRGKDMVFESGAIGGDRFLLGGYARHRTEKAKNGFVPREYLITGREGKALKLEAARNKLKAVPYAAASQFVHVRYEGKKCTSLFWKLGVSQCDFEGPNTDELALSGSNLIYQENGKGMAWDYKRGSRELLGSLDWIVGDGVNVVWSQEGGLYTQQVAWNLSELTSEAMPGAAGDKPIAIGCGRMLTKASEDYLLRNIKKGTQWTLNSERFPEEMGSVAAMNCEWVVFDSGYRSSLKSLGALTQLPEAKSSTKKEPAKAL